MWVSQVATGNSMWSYGMTAMYFHDMLDLKFSYLLFMPFPRLQDLPLCFSGWQDVQFPLLGYNLRFPRGVRVF